MQRDYVWKSKKVIKLLDSLHKGWPIGCFYVWHTEHEQPTKGRAGDHHIPVKSLDGFYGYLLDGQQRLTSLSLAIEAPAEHNLAARLSLEDGTDYARVLHEYRNTDSYPYPGTFYCSSFRRVLQNQRQFRCGNLYG